MGYSYRPINNKKIRMLTTACLTSYIAKYFQIIHYHILVYPKNTSSGAAGREYMGSSSKTKTKIRKTKLT